MPTQMLIPMRIIIAPASRFLIFLKWNNFFHYWAGIWVMRWSLLVYVWIAASAFKFMSIHAYCRAVIRFVPLALNRLIRGAVRFVDWHGHVAVSHYRLIVPWCVWLKIRWSVKRATFWKELQQQQQQQQNQHQQHHHRRRRQQNGVKTVKLKLHLAFVAKNVVWICV